MPLASDERLELDERIMQADLVQKTAATTLANRQNWWEGAKAVAMILLAAAAISAAARLADYLRPVNQQPMFPPGTVITIPPASK